MGDITHLDLRQLQDSDWCYVLWYFKHDIRIYANEIVMKHLRNIICWIHHNVYDWDKCKRLYIMFRLIYIGAIASSIMDDTFQKHNNAQRHSKLNTLILLFPSATQSAFLLNLLNEYDIIWI